MRRVAPATAPPIRPIPERGPLRGDAQVAHRRLHGEELRDAQRAQPAEDIVRRRTTLDQGRVEGPAQLLDVAGKVVELQPCSLRRIPGVVGLVSPLLDTVRTLRVEDDSPNGPRRAEDRRKRVVALSSVRPPSFV
jgi:hypothetical protein